MNIFSVVGLIEKLYFFMKLISYLRYSWRFTKLCCS